MTMTTATLSRDGHDGVVTREDPAAKPTRRRFSAAYKLAISGGLRALLGLRRKGGTLAPGGPLVGWSAIGLWQGLDEAAERGRSSGW